MNPRYGLVIKGSLADAYRALDNVRVAKAIYSATGLSGGEQFLVVEFEFGEDGSPHAAVERQLNEWLCRDRNCVAGIGFPVGALLYWNHSYD